MKIIVTGDEAPAKNLYQTAKRYLNYKDVELLNADDFEGALQAGKNLTEVDAYWITGRQRKRLTSLLTSIDPILQNKVNAGLPKILLLTLHSVNESHGLGVHVSRLVELLGYPHSHLLNVCCYSEAYANAIPNIEIRPGEASRPEFIKKMEQVKEWADTSDIYLWSFAVEKEDSDLLRYATEHLERQVLVKKQHFYDWLPATGEENDTAFKENLLFFHGELSSYSDELSKKVSSCTERPCKTYTDSLLFPAGLNIDLGEIKTPSKELRLVLIGNIWDRKTKEGIPWYEALDKALYEQVKDNNRITVTWYADPFRVQRSLEAAGFYRAKCLIWRGFRHDLSQELKGFDIGIIPHSPDSEITSSYTNYSIPSRILDYASAGLLTLAITPNNSGLQKKVQSEGLGYALTFQEFKKTPSLLQTLLKNKKELEAQREKIVQHVIKTISIENTFIEAMFRSNTKRDQRKGDGLEALKGMP